MHGRCVSSLLDLFLVCDCIPGQPWVSSRLHRLYSLVWLVMALDTLVNTQGRTMRCVDCAQTSDVHIEIVISAKVAIEVGSYLF